MIAEIVRWFPETQERGAYGFAKGYCERDIIVHADRIILGEPFVGAKIECKTILGKNNRLLARDVRIIG